MEKKCTKCGQTKRREDFNRDKTRKDGFSTWCRVCIADYRKTRAPLPESELPEVKFCSMCGGLKPLESFPKSATGSHGRGTYCTTCQTEYHTDRKMRKVYGVSGEEARNLRLRSCEICGGRTQHMSIDHSVDGSYHGVLCSNCNTAIGLLGHDPDVLETALEYVRRTRATILSK